MNPSGLAFDKSMRHKDVDGRLRVDLSNISKAQVSPYKGSEIPDFALLGLQANTIYYLLRDPDELAKAAPSFCNLPILIQHKPVNASEPAKNLIVGTIGSDVEFVAPHLRASLMIWDAAAIAGIESKEQAEISSGYRYRADMTPGVYKGVAYDGVMRDIIGNHVALVDVGRAGSDVVVGDSNPFINKEKIMPNQAKTRRLSLKAIAVAGALRTYLLPKIAQDQAVGSLRVLVGDVKAATYEKQKPIIAQRIRAAVAGKLAQDASLDDLDKVLNALSGTEDNDITGDDADEVAEGAEMEDDPDNPGQKRKKVVAAADTPPPGKDTPAPPSRAAMDAAIKTASEQVRKDVDALYAAREEVASLVGKVALDSAEAVYKFALDHAKIDTTGVHPSAYRSLIKMHLNAPKAAEPVALGMDAKAVKEAATRFPNLNRIKRIV